MRYIRDYDIIKERNDNVDKLLLLHPSLIQDELSKIEENCPIYTVKDNEATKNILIVNQSLEDDRYTGEMRYYIPSNVSIPIGGIDGKYYLETLGIYVSSKSGITLDTGYSIVERKSGKTLFEGTKLSYLGKNIAIINNRYIITKNNIIYHDDPCHIFDKSGYLLMHYKEDYDKIYETYFLYDSEGNIVGTDYNYDYKELLHLGKDAPELPVPSLPKNTAIFEQMIINSLKDKEQLTDCDSDNLMDIVNYLQSKNLDLAIDLDSLQVYKTNYNKYFGRQEAKGKARTLKPQN